MSRPNKPWFRAATGWWMVKLNGKQYKLAKGRKNKKAATAKFHELMASQAQLPESPNARVVDICEAFLEFSAKNHAADTYRNHRFYLQSFCEATGLLPVEQLRPYHVTRWCESKPWNETSQFNGRRYAFRAMNWAVSEGLLGRNPLQGMKRPKPRLRQRALTEEEYRAMIRASDGRFRLFLFVLRERSVNYTYRRPEDLRGEHVFGSVLPAANVFSAPLLSGTSFRRTSSIAHGVLRILRNLRDTTAGHARSGSDQVYRDPPCAATA